MDPLHEETHEASREQAYVVHHDVGFIQIPGDLWSLLYTPCYRITMYPCLRYKSRQMFIATLSRIHFVIKGTTLELKA